MRFSLMSVAALCVAVQAFTLLTVPQFWLDLFGRGDGTYATVVTVLLFLLSVLVEVLLLALWLNSAWHEFTNDVHQEENDERAAEIAQTSKVPEIRGYAIGKQISASRDRMEISSRAIVRSVIPMLFVAAIFSGIALWLAAIALGGS
ncbi:MAG: hypothetical protein ABL973_11250 [Micropepsaceae bacterium]